MTATRIDAKCWCCGWPCYVVDQAIFPRCDRCRMECTRPGRVSVTSCGLPAVYVVCECGHKPYTHTKSCVLCACSVFLPEKGN